ncbi:MAG TPA: helix-hairpin-helix domain-containing protein [Thermoanaerobaculia bacterium]|nr:helix-hairpin-helix domain-containing protein [Thermoanaerobaculia bacterium]
MDNVAIARVLAEVADVLEIQGADPFRIRAYRNAVRTIEVQTRPLARMLAEGAPLTSLPAIGKEMAGHIRELIETGTLAFRDLLLGDVPRGLLDLMRLPGVGPKKARRLWDELRIGSVDELAAAARAGKVAALAGFGDKTQAKILAGIEEHRQHGSRLLLAEAERYVEPLVAYLGDSPGLERLEVAGSYRRRCETVGDVDLLATAHEAAPVMAHFLAYPQIDQVLASGETRASVTLGNGLQIDLRVVPPDCYGAALVYFTGSKEHNVKLRRRAVERGLRISEYGVFRLPADSGPPPTADEPSTATATPPAAAASADPADPGTWIAGREEADVYAAVGLAWIPPELREDRGELEAAAAGRLPRLVELADMRGDLQMHSTWSDGRNTLEEMVSGCAARGYEYMAITDHSQALAMVNGLDARRLKLQWLEIDAIRARHPEIRLLRAMEIDILADGSLDLDDRMLAGLDLVVVSIHSRFELPADQQTARLLRALEHPEVDILAHPTGRLINRRKPIAFDVEAVLARAAELGVAVELNAQPDRLDLRDTHLLLARDLGCRIVISTDAHRVAELANMRRGVEQARRAGLEPRHVLNTLPCAELLHALARRGPDTSPPARRPRL